MTEQIMSPDESPETAPIKTGVRRVNNVPLFIIGGILATFLFIMILVAGDRAEKNRQTTEAKEDKKVVNTSTAFANEIAGQQMTGIVEPASPPTIPDIVTTAQAEPAEALDPRLKGDDLEALEVKLRQRQEDRALRNNGVVAATNDVGEAIKTAKLQLLENAIKSPTAVQAQLQASGGVVGGNNSSPKTREEMIQRIAALRQQAGNAGGSVEEHYKQRLEQIQGAGFGGTGTGGGGGFGPVGGGIMLASSEGGGNGYGQFDNRNGGDRWRLDSAPEPPRTAYVLRAGEVIPAVMIRGINSELPGQITAQISQNVYDTATGQHLLIPQGTKGVGQYSSEVVYGQSRVLAGWQRLTFPDGKAMDIGAMAGSDEAGYSGFHDLVNNHYVRIFGSAFLMSAIVAGINLSQEQQGYDQSDSQRASDAMSEALGQQLGQVAGQMISKNMNIAPTLEIRPGYRINIVVTKDLTFAKPYEAFDY